ncbi:MAG: hypothetical protein AB7J40_05810 [Candidatus Altimarinota bacterium]
METKAPSFPDQPQIEQSGRAELRRLQSEVSHTLAELKTRKESLTGKLKEKRLGQRLSEMEASLKQIKKDLKQKSDRRNSAFSHVIKAEQEANQAFQELEISFYTDLEAFLKTSPIPDTLGAEASSIDRFLVQMKTLEGLLEIKKKLKNYGELLQNPAFDISVAHTARSLRSRHEKIMHYQHTSPDMIRLQQNREVLKKQDTALLKLLEEEAQRKDEIVQTQRELQQIKSEIRELDELLKRGEGIRAAILSTLESTKSHRKSERTAISAESLASKISSSSETANLMPLKGLKITYIFGMGRHEEISKKSVEALEKAGARVITRDGDQRNELPVCDYVVFNAATSSHSSYQHYKNQAHSVGTRLITLPKKLGTSRVVDYVVGKIQRTSEKCST